MRPYQLRKIVMNKQTLISIIVIVAVVIGGLILLQRQGSKPGPNDGLARALKDSGTTFYGAFWCPHCADQKKLFGSSVPLLPYFECSTPDGNSQVQACTEKGIKSYPTWVFPDGSELVGPQALQTLADKIGYKLDAGANTEAPTDTKTSSATKN